MRGSPLTIQALTADSIYVANATVDTLITAYEKGADITMIGGLINGLGLSMIGGKPYKTYADLRGTTIGTQTLTSGTGFALRLVLKVHGMEYPRDYKLLNIGGAADRYQALTSGQISSAPVGVPLDLVAKDRVLTSSAISQMTSPTFSSTSTSSNAPGPRRTGLWLFAS